MSGARTLGAAVARVLAHQGGWDEAVLVAAPITVFAGLLWLAARRAARAQGEQQHEPDD